jgi:hypothetical protein
VYGGGSGFWPRVAAWQDGWIVAVELRSSEASKTGFGVAAQKRLHRALNSATEGQKCVRHYHAVAKGSDRGAGNTRHAGCDARTALAATLDSSPACPFSLVPPRLLLCCQIAFAAAAYPPLSPTMD